MLLTYFRLKHAKNNLTTKLSTVLLGGQFWFGTVWHRNPFQNENPSISNYQNTSLEIFAKFTKKHLCRSLFFKKVAGLRTATLINKILRHECFAVNFAKFLRLSFL